MTRDAHIHWPEPQEVGLTIHAEGRDWGVWFTQPETKQRKGQLFTVQSKTFLKVAAIAMGYFRYSFNYTVSTIRHSDGRPKCGWRLKALKF